MTNSTVDQRQAIVEVTGEGGRRILVRRMSWKAQREFLRELGSAVQYLVSRRSPDGPDAPAESFRATLFRELPEIVQRSDRLATLLCTGSTGLSLDEFDGLDSLAAAEVLRLSLEINFDDALKNSFAGIALSLAALVPAEAKTTSSATSTPTS